MKNSSNPSEIKRVKPQSKRIDQGKVDRMRQLYIADDNEDFAEFIATVAEREGWSVKTCINGVELLDAVKSKDGPALLLIDVNMPEMDGIESIKALVKVQRPLQIHFMTGGPGSTIDAAETIAKGYGLSVGGNIIKPVTKQALIWMLKQEASLCEH
ncbi:response regulator [uncultured Shimia sp.]|uniref:response regulator n=1 Tax=uncultured Shimia sp. TaxID=573152 RepID=UPI0025E05832|nr:response regulator [uncultured Shimia sp.]